MIMPVVWIPSLLRHLSGGQETVRVAGSTLGAVIEALESRFPGMKARLCDGTNLRPGMSVAVGVELARHGLAEPVGEDSEIHFLPAVSGGF